MKNLKALPIFSLLALAACTGQGPQYNAAISSPASVPAGKARLIVFRVPGIVGALESIPVKMDGHSFASLPRASFESADITPGVHDISAEAALWAGSAHLNIRFAPGSIHYVEASHSTDAIMGGMISPLAGMATAGAETGLYRLNEIEPGSAINELNGLKEAK